MTSKDHTLPLPRSLTAYRRDISDRSQVTGGHVCSALTDVASGAKKDTSIGTNDIVFMQRTIAVGTVRHQWVAVKWKSGMMHYEVKGMGELKDAPMKVQDSSSPIGPPEEYVAFGPCKKTHAMIRAWMAAWVQANPMYKVGRVDCQTFTTDLLVFLGISKERIPAGDGYAFRPW
jgi:hypothetical protein